MTRLWLLFALWGVSALMMLLLWQRQRRTKNAGTVDVAWSFGVGVAAASLALFASEGWFPRRTLVAGLALLWGGRLGLHLLTRMRRDGYEDGRYSRMRGIWGDSYDKKMFVFFQLQASWVLLFAIPMWAASTTAIPEWRLLDAIGVLLFATSWIGATMADRQLERFKARRASREEVCRSGLWAWSRHPNYFFEWIHWFGWSAIAVGSNHWWLPVLGAFVMLVFLLKVTGIPPTEKRLLESKGEAYRQYQREVSACVPLPPKRSEAGEPAGKNAHGLHS